MSISPPDDCMAYASAAGAGADAKLDLTLSNRVAENYCKNKADLALSLSLYLFECSEGNNAF